MKLRYSLALILGISLFNSGHARVAQEGTPSSTAKTVQLADKQEKEKAPLVACDVNADVQQCCSAAKCGGNVLSNRDRHNCKVKSGGKSWHPAARGGEPAVCVRP
ncbi:hypothetical protein QPK32_21415 [Massilia sp. YIM B02763]|uniref:hypothetical protein n=1 Tax=Massilia sp. YIM B02763 TaxID=3050130 RepID=UPI0025B63ADD|nr:hypothetical protein [Massilia sp. YIM B02763]MDN4055634.1 hypothetical protein [Massilia sp. YIM B02763]